MSKHLSIQMVQKRAHLLYNILEHITNVLITFGRCFDEERPMLARKFATLLTIDDTLLIDFVANHNNRYVGVVTVAVQLGQPSLQFDQRFAICDVIDEYGAQRLAIEAGRQAAKSFGARCVPQCNLVVYAIHIHDGALEVHANCDVMIVIELVLNETTYQTAIGYKLK